MRRINEVDVLTTIEELVEPARSAVIVIDMQNESVSKQGGHARAGTDISGVAAIVPRIQRLLKAARDIGVLVTYTEHIFQSKLGANLMAAPKLYQYQCRHARYVSHAIEGGWEAETIDELAPQTGDVVIRKSGSYGSSAMYHNILDDVLRIRGTRSLILTGIVTGGCVMRTAVDATQHDYYAVVIRDCVGSHEMKSHELALAWMETRFPVFDLDEVLGTWQEKL